MAAFTQIYMFSLLLHPRLREINPHRDCWCAVNTALKSVSGLYLLMWKSTKVRAPFFFRGGGLLCPCCIFDSIIDALFSASGLPCNQQRIPEQHKGEGSANLNEFSHSQLIYIIYMYLADMFPPSQAAAGRKTGTGLHKLKVLNEHVQ